MTREEANGLEEMQLILTGIIISKPIPVRSKS